MLFKKQSQNIRRPPSKKKKTFFQDWDRVRLTWNVETPKMYFYCPYWFYIPNFNLLVQFGAKIGMEQPFYKVKKGKFLISPLFMDIAGWFLWFKPYSTPLSNLSITELPKMFLINFYYLKMDFVDIPSTSLP